MYRCLSCGQTYDKLPEKNCVKCGLDIQDRYFDESVPKGELESMPGIMRYFTNYYSKFCTQCSAGRDIDYDIIKKVLHEANPKLYGMLEDYLKKASPGMHKMLFRTFYFAYGSNLSTDQMRRRCPDSKLLGAGCLEYHRLDFTIYSPTWRGGVANVVQELDNEVWGLLYEISEDDLKSLDRYEGYPSLYDRFKTTIKTPEGNVFDAWVYEVVTKKPFIAPTKDYMGIIKKAAAEFKFPEKYRSFLDTIETA